MKTRSILAIALIAVLSLALLAGCGSAATSASKEPVKNPDLWKQLCALFETHRVELVWVKGHDGHPENERCDALATGYIKTFQK